MECEERAGKGVSNGKRTNSKSVMETLGLRIGKLSAETAIEVQKAGQRVDDTGAGDGRGEEGRAGGPFAHGWGNIRGAKVPVSISVFSRRWKYALKTRTAE